MNRLCPCLIALLALPLLAAAHHFKGLPHFNYFENYPQVPQEEFLARGGDFELSLVLYDFQGIDRAVAEQPDDVRLFLAIYDLRHDRFYRGPLKIAVMDGATEIASRPFAEAEEESLYSLNEALPASGDYALMVYLPEELATAPIRVPFKLSSQKIHWGKWIAAGLGALVLVLIVGARRARVAMDRREAVNGNHREEREDGG